jgi:vacuolar-type H+-ATPase subunit F/Vma7
MKCYDMIRYDTRRYDTYLTAIGFTLGGSSTVHIYTKNAHNTMSQNTQNRTYITIIILKLKKEHIT